MSKSTTATDEPIDTSRFIRQGDFCEVVTDGLREYGLKRGHFVFVAGMKAVPEDITDPYTQRMKCWVHPSNKEGEIDMSGFMIVDPRSLDKVSVMRQEAMTEVFHTQVEQLQLLDAESPSEVDH